MADPLGVSVGFDDPPMTVNPTWTRIDTLAGCRVTDWTIDRGRPNEFAKTGTGTAVVHIVDRHGLFDPTNTIVAVQRQDGAGEAGRDRPGEPDHVDVVSVVPRVRRSVELQAVRHGAVVRARAAAGRRVRAPVPGRAPGRHRRAPPRPDRLSRGTSCTARRWGRSPTGSTPSSAMSAGPAASETFSPATSGSARRPTHPARPPSTRCGTPPTASSQGSRTSGCRRPAT